MEENITVRVGADISDLAREMGRAKQEVSDFGTRMNNFGKNLRDTAGGVAMSFGAIATGIALPLKQAVQTSVDFDSAMRRAGAIAGATSEEFDALKQTALDLGASTTKSASEVATAMTEMAAKGYDANQIIAAMPGIIAAAEASGEDLALTADTVSSALNAFGLEASEATRVADILAETANKSAAGIQDMQYSFKYAAPVVSSLGVSLEELAAATGIMAKRHWPVVGKLAA
jgi:TP901 family phage tail tape measure protein